MEFGLFYQLSCADGQSVSARYDDTIAQARLADELGFDTVWLAELHFNRRFSVMPSPLLMASAIAATTKRIKIGTAVNLVPLHHPIRLAEETATLDILSHGRAVFGIGRGANPRHFEGYGVDIDEGRSGFQEAVELVLKAWTTDELFYQGKHYQVDGIQVEPKPYQKPHPPVYVAAESPDTFSMVGSMGHSVLLAPMIATSEVTLAGLHEYWRSLTGGAPDPTRGKVTVSVPTFVAESDRKARAAFEASIDNYLDTLRASSRGWVKERSMKLSYERINDEFAAIGDPEHCVAKLQEVKEIYQAQEIMCWFNMGGLVPEVDVEKSMRLFAEEVMPHFR